MLSPNTNQFDQIWQVAIKRYEEVTHKKLDDLNLKNLDSIAGLERAIDQKNGNMTEFRAKRSMLFNVLRTALIPVELLAKLGAGDASAAFPPSSLVFGAVTYLIAAAKDVSTNYDSIRDLMVSLQEFTTRLKIYSRENISEELQLKLAEVLTTLLEVFALARKAIKRGRVLGFVRSVVLARDPDVKGALEKLNRLTKSEDLLVGAETHTEVTRQGRTVNEVVTVVSESQFEIREGRMDNREMHNELMTMLKETQSMSYEKSNPREKVKKTLRPSVFPLDTYKRLAKDKVPGTGEWIFAEKVFTAWAVDKTFPVLFIQGIPGAGKSFLSTNMISYFTEQFPQGVQSSARVSICYFFFKDNNPETRSIHQALRDLAFQVCLNDAVYAKHVETTCLSFDDVKSIESAWQKLFVEFFVENEDLDSTAILILDGLDEAYETERVTFLPLLQEMKPDGRGVSRLQLALVGRPHLSDEITDALEQDTVPTILIDGSKNSEDITNYIQSSIRKSRILKKVSKELRTLVTKTLTERANGMFLWVDLMMRELNHKNRELAIREALEKAPKGLDEMIRHVLEGLSESLSSDDAQDLNEMLAWVTCAKKPLTLGHLDAILRYGSPTGDGLITLESMLRKTYASFFLLTREDGLSTTDLLNFNQNTSAYEDDVSSEDDEPGFRDTETLFESNPLTTEIAFCHASIGDFFRNRSQGKVQSADGLPIGVDIDDANFKTLRTIFMLCTDKSMQEKAPDQSFLTNYAAPLWKPHMQDTNISKTRAQDKKALGPVLIKFCRDPHVIETWAYSRGYDFWLDDYVAVFRRWLDDEELLSSLPSEDQEWINSTAQHPASVFIELAKFNAMKWLQDMWWIPGACAWSVFGYRQRIAGVQLRPSEEGLEGAHNIVESAEWAGYERNALWHRRLAIALRDNSFLDEAQSHFEIALELDSTMWRIQSGLAQIASLRQEYQKAIDFATKEIEVVQAYPAKEPKFKDVQLSYAMQLKGDNYSELKDDENAYVFYRQASATNASNYKAVKKCVAYLDDRNQHQELIELIKEVFETPNRSPYLVRYTAAEQDDSEYMNTITQPTRRAARETGELPYLVDKIRKAIDFCRHNRLGKTAIQLEVYLADIYHYEHISSDRAIRIWEHIRRMATGPTDYVLANAQVRSTKMLSIYYFTRARETTGLERAQYVSSLEAMAKSRGRLGESYNLSAASMILGQWYRLNGQSEEANACFQVHVKQTLEALSDDDPDNDDEAFISLGFALLCAGDEVNASAVLQKLFGISEDPGKPEDDPSARIVSAQDQPDTNQVDSAVDIVASEGSGDDLASSIDPGADVNFRLLVHCDGLCPEEKRMARKDPVWICRFCTDIGFCEECFTLLKADKLPINQCSPQHSWMRFQATKKIIPASQMLIGEAEFVDFEEWKKGLKQNWGLG